MLKYYSLLNTNQNQRERNCISWPLTIRLRIDVLSLMTTSLKYDLTWQTGPNSLARKINVLLPLVSVSFDFSLLIFFFCNTRRCWKKCYLMIAFHFATVLPEQELTLSLSVISQVQVVILLREQKAGNWFVATDWACAYPFANAAFAQFIAHRQIYDIGSHRHTHVAKNLCDGGI